MIMTSNKKRLILIDIVCTLGSIMTKGKIEALLNLSFGAILCFKYFFRITLNDISHPEKKVAASSPGISSSKPISTTKTGNRPFFQHASRKRREYQ